MKVNLATQVYSNTMASAMSTLAALSESQAQAEGLRNASNHSRKWNQIFDIFNSDGPGPVNRQSSKQTVSDKLPLKPDNRQIELLEEELLPWIKKIKILRPVKEKKTTSKTPKKPKIKKYLDYTPCILGWIRNINCLKLLWEELSTKYGFEYLATRRLNQDGLENYFSILRNSSGHNDHPTSSIFQNVIHGLITNHVMQVAVAGSNCEDDLTPLLESCENSTNNSKAATGTASNTNLVQTGVTESSDAEDLALPSIGSDELSVEIIDDELGESINDETTVFITSVTVHLRHPTPKTADFLLAEVFDEKLSMKVACQRQRIAYMAGFIKEKMKKHECNLCQNTMNGNPDVTHNLFTNEKSWAMKTKMNYASEAVFNITQELDNIFKTNIDRLLIEEKLKERLLNINHTILENVV